MVRGELWGVGFQADFAVSIYMSCFRLYGVIPEMTASVAPAFSFICYKTRDEFMIWSLRARPTLPNLIGWTRYTNMSAFQKAQQASQESRVHTIEELKRWSVGDQELPSMIVISPQ